MNAIGYSLLKIVYRGYSTSAKLQAMHDEAAAKRTSLRLQSATAQVEQAEQAMQLQCASERAEGENALASSAARHKLELLRLEGEERRRERDADHEQGMRHERENAQARLSLLVAEHDEELRRAS